MHLEWTYLQLGTNRFLFAVDGEQNSADFTVNVNGSATTGGLVSGHTFASVVQATLQWYRFCRY